MSTAINTLKVGTIRTRKIVTHSLQVKSHTHHESRVHLRELRRRVRKLQLEVHTLRHELRHTRRHLEHQIEELRERVARLEAALAGGIPANPALQSLFTSKLGQVVTVSTASGTLTGTVTVAGTNAVELTESSGDILVIPYSQITGVQ